MSSRGASRKVAYMEDEDEFGNTLEETKTYAASSAPSPTKEKPNTSRTRRDKSRRDSSSPANGLTDSDSTVHPSSAVKRESKMKSRDKEREREREKDKSSGSKKQVTLVRPSTKHSKTVPNLQSNAHRRSHDESMYYGVTPLTTTTTASSRPRAHTSSQRPNSYYGGSSSRPPLSNARFQHHYPPPPPPGALPTSFPPQAWQSAGPVSYPVQPSPVLPPQPVDYFASRPNNPLSARFNRPASAMGYRASPTTIAYGNGSDYDQEADSLPLIRRVSLTRKARDQEDRDRMPPPPRPSTTVTMRPSPFAPPPRRTVGFDDDAFGGDGSLYQDVSPLARYEGGVSRPRRPSIGAPTVSYDLGSYRTEVAGRSSRRNSYYGEQSMSSGNGYEDQLRSATSYQHDVEGGPTMPLTAETLRKASKNSKTSSRSTRSSGSHDESDFRRSNTTHTTRSSNDEDITIRVKGAATLKVGGAEMECKDGAEININSRNTGGTIRGGSDRDSSIYGDDRRTRIDRLPTRTRASSQAGSYTRTAPPLMYDQYGYPAIPYRPAAAPPPEWL